MLLSPSSSIKACPSTSQLTLSIKLGTLEWYGDFPDRTVDFFNFLINRVNIFLLPDNRKISE